VESNYSIAGIDVHKKMLAVVVARLVNDELQFERQKFGSTGEHLRMLREWLAQRQVQEVVMESTAQYWKPVWRELESHCRLHLAQAQSNRAPRGRKRDFADAERLVRRLIAGELILSYVPDAEQRLWRTLTHSKIQMTRDQARIVNQLEAVLEDAHLKLSSFVSDLLGVSSRRMLKAVGEGETDPVKLAALADRSLRATPEQLCDALSASATLGPLHRQIVKQFVERWELLERHREEVEQSIASMLRAHQHAVVRVAEVPGLGVASAHQIIAEIGPHAAVFASAGQLASWIGVCPGREESAGHSVSDRSPKGNRAMRRILNQAANAAVKAQGSVFQGFYRRLVARIGHNKAIWAVAHKLCRVVWRILHHGESYLERGIRLNKKALKQRTNRLVAQLKHLGYAVQLTSLPPEVSV
jgi:transposase